MRISWGTKIVLVFVAFVTLIMSMVVGAVMQDDIHLVAKDYYKEELAYQDRINALKNARHPAERPELRLDTLSREMDLRFPHPDLKGNIHFFRPSDARKDFQLPLKPDEQGLVALSLQDLSPGLWKAQISWQRQGREFYLEKRFSLPPSP